MKSGFLPPRRLSASEVHPAEVSHCLHKLELNDKVDARDAHSVHVHQGPKIKQHNAKFLFCKDPELRTISVLENSAGKCGLFLLAKEIPLYLAMTSEFEVTFLRLEFVTESKAPKLVIQPKLVIKMPKRAPSARPLK